MAFGSFIGRYGGFFRTRTRDNAAVAERYLQGLAQAEEATFAAMATVVEQGCEQQFQHFISNSPWRHEPVVEQIGRDADRLLGGKPTSALIIDESSFVKQGEHSVGVARQWCGRLGKVDNCQVAVFAVLTDGQRHAPVDMRLYLPQRWIEDPKRCDRAGIPVSVRAVALEGGAGAGDRARGAGARDAVRLGRRRRRLRQGARLPARAGRRRRGVRRRRALHPVVWTEPPGLHVPAPKSPRGRHADQATGRGRTPHGGEAGQQVPRRGLDPLPPARQHPRSRCRSTSRTGGSGCGTARKRTARCWHLIVRREVGSPKTVKYSLSNAPADTTPLQLARMQGQRYWVERAFEDAKGQCGLADYQVQGWLAWHHHVTMVMLAMLFIAEQRAAHQPALALLSPRDIVEMLKETLPRKPEGKAAWSPDQPAPRPQTRRHQSRFRTQRRAAPIERNTLRSR